MHRYATLASIWLGLSGLGCNTSPLGSYDEAADEVEDSVSALSSDDTEMAVDTLDEVADDTAATGSNAKDRPLRGRWLRRHRPHGRGHGLGLLVWYADLDALAQCRDLRDQCKQDDSQQNCRPEVRSCVRPVLRQAFLAMCEEPVAMCQESTAPERPCARIHRHCDGFVAEADAGTDG